MIMTILKLSVFLIIDKDGDLQPHFWEWGSNGLDPILLIKY